MPKMDFFLFPLENIPKIKIALTATPSENLIIFTSRSGGGGGGGGGVGGGGRCGKDMAQASSTYICWSENAAVSQISRHPVTVTRW